MEFAELLPLLLGSAWLLPLASFVLIVFFGPRMGKAGKGAGHVATAAILGSFLLSVIALLGWLAHHPLASHAAAEGSAHHTSEPIRSVVWYTLAEFGSLRITISHYIDSLTIAMFCMVTLVASCIHFYSFGYMHEELREVTDPLAKLANGQPLVRPGRFHRFYQYLSLFCFSMLGLVIAGNIAMVFVFWELVGICSYFLIGFYIERKSASNAANKAFIVNRVGDFGMLIGLMILWTGLGTFSFGDTAVETAQGEVVQPGIFSLVRPANHDANTSTVSEHTTAPQGHEESASHEHGDESTATEHALIVPEGMIRLASKYERAQLIRTTAPEELEATLAAKHSDWHRKAYWLLILAGLGIFCGCVGKSAQFPLQVWLPDAMEGPTPVSALIHAATMVAAGVYLVGRFFPVFVPEVLLVIACIGCITLFLAATIAITATDIKRVLAFSTVSQLGYMMLGLGVGGWLAGLFHLFTHAFFKSLLFLGSGSVIHACKTNEMSEMGGLRKKMPWTAYTMLAGCLAISGAGIPLVIGLSGYYSKDSILAQVYSFSNQQPHFGQLFFYLATGGAAITAFYMFRLWFLTFAGKPRSESVFKHAHESPRVMYIPLVVLATLAVVAGWGLPFTNLSLTNLLEQARPAGTALGVVSDASAPMALNIPAESLSHASSIHVTVSLVASLAALIGFGLAATFYGVRTLDPEDVRRTFPRLYRFLLHKWWFDELYHRLFVRPVMWISDKVSWLDKEGLDRIANGMAQGVLGFARIDGWIDRRFDSLIDLGADGVYRTGLWLRTLQTGKLRQYVRRIAMATVMLFVLIALYWEFVVVGRY